MARAKIRRLPDFDPITREELAQWIEENGEAEAQRIPEARRMLREYPDHPALPGQIAHWGSCLSWSKRLAYLVRQARTKMLRSPTEREEKQRKGTHNP